MADYTPGRVRVGLISDTHDTLPEEVIDLFADVSTIIHAGDVGSADVLWRLSSICEVVAVAGNTDGYLPAWPLEGSVRLTRAGIGIRVVHDLREVARSRYGETDVIVSGHTHRPEVLKVGNTLLVNPGSASYSRTEDKVGTVAILDIDDGQCSVQLLRIG